MLPVLAGCVPMTISVAIENWPELLLILTADIRSSRSIGYFGVEADLRCAMCLGPMRGLCRHSL